MILGFFPFQWADSAVTVPTIEGLEYTLPDNRLHFSFDDNKLHYDFRDNRLHYSTEDENGS